MEIAERIASELATLKDERERLVVGICGRAGAGKTTLAEILCKELEGKEISTARYSGDWRFVMDSESRRRWLEEKWKAGIDAYMYAINQFSWWNFEEIENDLRELILGNSVTIADAYNRESGKKNLQVHLQAVQRGVICYENCVLGGLALLETLDLVVLLNTPDGVCLERLVKKDSQRRNIQEITTRYLITTYSENIFLNQLLGHFLSKTVPCDANGNFSSFPEIHQLQHIPVPIVEMNYKAKQKGTIFCDLDGTLIRHVPVPSASGDEIEVLDGSVEKLREFAAKGYYVVLTTSRPYDRVFGPVEKLKAIGLDFDQIICDLPVGPRHLINDNKGDECRAFVHLLRRDEGIKSIYLP